MGCGAASSAAISSPMRRCPSVRVKGSRWSNRSSTPCSLPGRGSKYTTAIGYSWQDNDNTDAQAPDAFRVGKYALGNLLYTPVPNVMMGGELQWGRRENFSDGFQSDGFKIQFSFKYNFSWKLGG